MQRRICNQVVHEIVHERPVHPAAVRANGEMNPSEFAAYIASESAKMKRLIELTGMRAD